MSITNILPKKSSAKVLVILVYVLFLANITLIILLYQTTLDQRADRGAFSDSTDTEVYAGLSDEYAFGVRASLPSSSGGVRIAAGEIVDGTTTVATTTVGPQASSTSVAYTGTSRIGVVGVSVEDVDATGEAMERQYKGTVVGLDLNTRTFIIAESGTNTTYQVQVAGQTEIYLGEERAVLRNLSVGDVVEVTAVATETTKEFTADTVTVVAKLQLFDEGQ